MCICLLCIGVVRVTKDKFFGYPFNTISGYLPRSDDAVSYIALSDNFPFLGEKYQGMQVCVGTCSTVNWSNLV